MSDVLPVFGMACMSLIMKIKPVNTFAAAIFTSAWLLLFMAGQSKLFRDPGTFAHTVLGECILSSGHLIYQDGFSFTRFRRT